MPFEAWRAPRLCRFSSLYITWVLAFEIGIGIRAGGGRGLGGILMMIDIAGFFLPLRRRRQGRVIMVMFMVMIVLLLEQVYPLESRGEVDVVREADLAVRVRIDGLDSIQEYQK